MAAPTAGLHFTDEVFEKLRCKGIQRSEVTLHVGAGTFKPVDAEYISEHIMHNEKIFITSELIDRCLAFAEKPIISESEHI